MLSKQTKTLTFPVADNTLSTTYIEISYRVGVNTITVAWDGALPTTGSVVVKTLKDGGDPAVAADWVNVAAPFTSPGTATLAGVQGIRVYALSGTGTGDVAITVVAN